MKHEKERLKFSENDFDHSNWLSFNGKTIVQSMRKRPCYAELHSCKHKITSVYLFFPKDLKECQKEFMKWLINESFLKSVYVTKDIEEGLKYGFELKTGVDITLFKVASIMLREPVETIVDARFWHELVGMGYSGIEAYSIQVSFKKIKIENIEILIKNPEGDGHRGLPTNLSFKDYNLKYEKVGISLKSNADISYFNAGIRFIKSIRISDLALIKGLEDLNLEHYRKTFKFSKENLDTILKNKGK